MTAHADAATLDSALLARQAWIERASRRWHLLVHGATLAFVVMLYSNPQFWWPWFEQLRLAFVAMAVGAFALLMHRVTSGERIRMGGPGVIPLLAYLSFVPLSLAWTISQPDTIGATIEAAKMAVVFVVVQNAVDGPQRLRRFMLVGTLAALGPALGAIDVWRNDDALIDGFRTHWRGPYADPNRLAMCLIAVMPFALYGAVTAKKRWVRVLFAATLAAQLAAIVLTHSRSGSVAAALALALFLFRGKTLSSARKLGAAAAIALGLIAFAPSSFWERNATITQYETDVSVEGRENAWKVLGVIVAERPLTGVGASAYIQAWGRYAPLEAGGRRYVAHNILLEIVGELGVIAFLLFCAFVAWLLPKLWRVGSDPLVGTEARAIFAALAGYLVIEMANGYSLSWFLYFLFACGLVTMRLSRERAALGRELPPWAAR
ncbi:O-antigen ligase family protein [Anaeromyxobacter terrae]|uniref:O-antigen ligase family protein n=1 Tax=Anaeromyxobacter terrae TaxID=2925406 RepID=UPI001F5812C4|nr:O-antigen ligase family protein [Anaeromyxobacter sp. SG22]